MKSRLAIAALHAIGGAIAHGGRAALKPGPAGKDARRAALAGAIRNGIGGYAGARLGGAMYDGARAAGLGRVIGGYAGFQVYGVTAHGATMAVDLGGIAARDLARKAAQTPPVKKILRDFRKRALKAQATLRARRGR